MKRTILLFSLFITVVSIAQENILKNGGFEDRTGDPQADNWISNGTIDRYEKKRKEGKASMRLTSQYGFFYVLSQGGYREEGDFIDYEIKPNTPYTLTYWVLDDTDKAKLHYKVQWKDTDKKIIKVTEKDPLANPQKASEDNAEWKKITVTSVSPANAKHFLLNFYAKGQNGAGGSIYLDKVSFQEGATASINENVLERENIACYYNASTQKINIALKNNTKVKDIKIYNVLGKKISEISKLQSTNRIYVQKPIEAGICIVRINTAKGIYTQKIIITK